MPLPISRKKKNRAFTLIELLLAVAIFASVGVVIHSCFYVGVKAYRRMQISSVAYQQARLALERIALNLRNAIFLSIEEKDTSGFSGDEESLSFYSILPARQPACPAGRNEGVPPDEIYKLEYYTQTKDGEGILYEKRFTLIDTFQEDPQVEPMELATGVTEFKLSYAYKTTEEAEEPPEWKEDWDEEEEDKDKIPLGVKIEMSIKEDKEKEEELKLVKFVFVPTGALSDKP